MEQLSLSEIDFLSISDKLRQTLGEPEVLHQSSPLAYCTTPLEFLIATILTQATSDRNALNSWFNFKKSFPQPESALEVEEEILREVIRSGGLANQKAKTIRAVLMAIRERSLQLSRNALGESHQLLREMLLSLPGVGPKTAACVLLFGFKLPEFPVDTHIHRIVIRMGWVTPKSSPDEAQRLLSPVIPVELQAPLHILLLNLGRRNCRPRNPNCRECPLNQDCNLGKGLHNANIVL
ncbi:MAG: endonuclease III [Firmicutes bacterium]|nr:endonuclease III [Bacillota bacterium]